MQKAVTSLLMVAAVSAQDKVVVNFYAESLCPGCRGAVKGPINETFTAQGVPDIMDFTYYPFGNAIVKTKECGSDYSCWKEKCGPRASNPPSDCFTGEVECQHGKQECYGNLVETCVKNMTHGDASKYMPFVYCFEAEGEASQRRLQICAPRFGLNIPTINACVEGPQGKALTAIDAKATIAEGKNYVPYININGRALRNTDNLLSDVCNDWKGTKPPGCK